MTVIVSTLKRGGGGTSPFPTDIQENIKIPHVSKADLSAMHAIPEWKRLSKMTCFVISENKVYRLGTDTTIAGQVWTEEATGPNVQTRDEKNQPDGYVGLNSDGYIDPQYIQSVYAQDYYTADDEAGRFALDALTGDICQQLDNNNIFIKKNNNPAPTTNADWANITTAAAVTLVNNQAGVVQIDVDALLAFGSSQTQFEAAVAATPAITQIEGEIASNDNDITNLWTAVNGILNDSSATIPVWDSDESGYVVGNNVIYTTGAETKLYRCIQNPPQGTLPTNTSYWAIIGFSGYQPHANTWYVSKNGSNSSNGSPQTPFLTIAYAISQASAGDVIKIAAGTYSEVLTIDKNLSFEGDGFDVYLSTTLLGSTLTLDNSAGDVTVSFTNISLSITSTLAESGTSNFSNIILWGAKLSAPTIDIGQFTAKESVITGDVQSRFTSALKNSLFGGEIIVDSEILDLHNTTIVGNITVTGDMDQYNSVITGAVSVTGTSNIKSQTTVFEAPEDGNQYARKDGSWVLASAPPAATFDDKHIQATATTNDGDTTGVSLTNTPTGAVQIMVGDIAGKVEVQAGDASKVAVCYWSRDAGVTALALNALQTNDTLYWNQSEAGYNLTTEYFISLNY